GPPARAMRQLGDKIEAKLLAEKTGVPVAAWSGGAVRDVEEALRHGVRNLIEAFGKVSPMTINLGNEPHGTGARVLANVAAYRAVYEEAKRVDPSITVVATSVEPNEEYFKAGYGKWCDAFDFHIYETAADVRRTIGEYRQLMEKYGVVKPIWSTELGLNSQGQTRQAVAGDLIRKFATFFAAGGERVSWFGLLYPDTEGKNHGNSGDSHNIFDCRYNRYAPRLDAVAYYNGVNAIGIKRFMAERNYPGNISAFLFRDRAGHSLQVLWKEKGRQDVFIPLKGTGAVQVIRIDGSRRKLNAGANGITLTLGEDPLLLLYESAETTLPETFGSPIATLEPPREGIRRGVPAIIKVAGSGDVDLVAPPFWVVNKAPSTSGIVTFTVTPPSGSALHHADLTFILGNANGSHPGELYLHCPVSE
ncbi:MAG: glycosyl hydrolase, partial [Verrucomicrobiota bacterium]